MAEYSRLLRVALGQDPADLVPDHLGHRIGGEPFDMAVRIHKQWHGFLLPRARVVRPHHPRN